MKKIVLTLVVILFSIPAFAQLEQGQHMLGIRAGIGFQLNNAGISYGPGGGTADWGTLGADAALSYYYLATPYVGVGAEISYGSFNGGDLTNVGTHHEVTDDTNLYSFMLSARLTPNPEQRFRFYVPLGVGLVTATQDLDIDYHSTRYQKKATDNSFGWFVGLGLESDIGHKGWSWGVEMRYSAFWYNSNKLANGAPDSIQADGKRRLDYMTFMLRVNKRF